MASELRRELSWLLERDRDAVIVRLTCLLKRALRALQ
jgi:hypothetical protein